MGGVRDIDATSGGVVYVGRGWWGARWVLSLRTPIRPQTDLCFVHNNDEKNQCG